MPKPYPRRSTIATVDEWRVFLARVRQDVFMPTVPKMLIGVTAADFSKVPLAYQEDLYGLTPVASLAVVNDALTTARARHPNVFTNRKRLRKLRELERASEWIAQTAGSFRGLGAAYDHRPDEIPILRLDTLNDSRANLNLAAVQYRLESTFVNLMLMVEQPNLVAETLAGTRRWRVYGLPQWERLNGLSLLAATEQAYEQWLPRYHELINYRY